MRNVTKTKVKTQSLREYLKERTDTPLFIHSEADPTLYTVDAVINDLYDIPTRVLNNTICPDPAQIVSFCNGDLKNIIILEAPSRAPIRAPFTPVGDRVLLYEKDKYGDYSLLKTFLLVSAEKLNKHKVTICEQLEEYTQQLFEGPRSVITKDGREVSVLYEISQCIYYLSYIASLCYLIEPKE